MAVYVEHFVSRIRYHCLLHADCIGAFNSWWFGRRNLYGLDSHRFFADFRHCFAACFNRDDWLVCILHADWMELLWGAGSAVSGRSQRHYAVSGWLLCSCIAWRCYANADHLVAFGSLQWVNGNSQFNWTFTIVRANSKKFTGLGKKKSDDAIRFFLANGKLNAIIKGSY